MSLSKNLNEYIVEQITGYLGDQADLPVLLERLNKYFPEIIIKRCGCVCQHNPGKWWWFECQKWIVTKNTNSFYKCQGCGANVCWSCNENFCYLFDETAKHFKCRKCRGER